LIYDGVAYDRREIKKKMLEFGKEMGFRSGSCTTATKQNYIAMGLTLFTMGSAVLYLTPGEIDEFTLAMEERGRPEPFKISETWPPNG
jgi:hypothetical protein